MIACPDHWDRADSTERCLPPETRQTAVYFRQDHQLSAMEQTMEETKNTPDTKSSPAATIHLTLNFAAFRQTFRAPEDTPEATTLMQRYQELRNVLDGSDTSPTFTIATPDMSATFRSSELIGVTLS